MNSRFVVATVALTGVLFLAPLDSISQPQTSEDRWLLTTPWGDPEFQGKWSFATITPLERPEAFAGRERLTDEEIAAYNAFWFDRGESTGRTSLILDPTDGRIPFTRAGRARVNSRRSLLNRPAHGPEDRSPGERCVHHTKAGPPMSAGGYNNNLRLLQTPDYVVVWTEQIHDARMIPMDGRPSIADNIRQWMGDSRGYWQGQTLVVETTHFNGKAGYQGSSAELRLVERFTRTDANTLIYAYTIEDPASYTRPWTASIAMESMNADLYEFACHEGNYGMVGILAGARADEKAAAAPR